MSVGTNVPNGGAESYVELAKALNTLGQTTLSTSANASKWALNAASIDFLNASAGNLLPEFDYEQALIGFKATGTPVYKAISSATVATSGDLASSCFAFATDLETSSGLEISGLNAEEQSDISLLIRYSAPQTTGMTYEVFTYIDSMIVLRENNVYLVLTIGFRINSISVNCMI